MIRGQERREKRGLLTTLKVSRRSARGLPESARATPGHKTIRPHHFRA
jgi:hypothetical protein